jgi:hypothetical protein
MGSACCRETKVHHPAPIRRKSTPPRPESGAMQRFNKVSINSHDPLRFIDGYLDEPLVSLEEALQPFDGDINQLYNHIHEAKTKCHYPSEHHLTRDESAAIYIYTMKWKPECLHERLHAAWNSGNRSQLKPWFKYLKLFKSALDKLPDTKKQIWQGIAYDEHMKDKLSSKSSPLFSSLGSCSTSEDELKKYLHDKYGPQTILIGYDSVHGKSISQYGVDQDSHEVILWAGAKVGVAKMYEADGNGSLIYHLKGRPGKYHRCQAYPLCLCCY